MPTPDLPDWQRSSAVTVQSGSVNISGGTIQVGGGQLTDPTGNVSQPVITQVTTAFFGSGADGAVTLSANATLIRNMQYSTLTLASAVTLTSAWAIFVNDTLSSTGSPLIANNGSDGGVGGSWSGSGSLPQGGSGGTGAQGGFFPAAPGGANGANGVASGSNAGVAGGSFSTTGLDIYGGANGGNGGAGGIGGGGAGGTSGKATRLPVPNPDLLSDALGPGGAGGSGAAGYNSGANGGSPGGGGGGGAGGCLIVCARHISGTIAIRCRGGNGGTGGSFMGTVSGDYSGGGGGGGAGGSLLVFYETTASGWGPTLVDCLPGSGGPAGQNTLNPGSVGTAGQQGAAGYAYVVPVKVAA